MIVDTSVWIQFLRSGRSSAAEQLAQRVRDGKRIVIPETVMMELLVGPTDEAAVAHVQRMLEAFEVEPYVPLADSLRAAALQRSCRRAGETVRSLGDCLVAAMALRLDLAVMHRDRDFEALARCSSLRTVSLLDG